MRAGSGAQSAARRTVFYGNRPPLSTDSVLECGGLPPLWGGRSGRLIEKGVTGYR